MLRQFEHVWSAIRLPLCNTFIVVVMALILVDALPFMPRRLRALTDPIMQKTGLTQGEWSMFSPQPDHKNTRFSAAIEYSDGSFGEWHSPAWRKQSLWRSFTDSRYREYLDNVSVPLSEPALPALADHIAGNHVSKKVSPRKVTMWIETAEIPEPRAAHWPPMAEPAEYGPRRLFFEREYP